MRHSSKDIGLNILIKMILKLTIKISAHEKHKTNQKQKGI